MLAQASIHPHTHRQRPLPPHRQGRQRNARSVVQTRRVRARGSEGGVLPTLDAGCGGGEVRGAPECKAIQPPL